MPNLPVIDPDESTDQPRCRAECGSFEFSGNSKEYGRRCLADPDIRGPFVRVTLCQPRLLQAYAELRELKARQCDGCENWRNDPDAIRRCRLSDEIWPASGHCHQWKAKR